MSTLINSAIAEKLAALMTEKYLEARAARGNERKFKAVLAKVRDTRAEPEDALEETGRRTTRRKSKATSR